MIPQPRRRCSLIRYLAIVVAAALPQATWASDWLHWRGPEQNGVARDTGLPDKWSPTTPGENNLLWKHPIGARSTPVVCRGKVYLISNCEPGTVREQERVTCFDVRTGKILWEHRFNLFHTDIVTNRVGWANLAADPETGNVYAHGVQGMFFCFAPDGQVLWSRSLTEEFGRVSGYGGRIPSPIVDEDRVIVHFLNASWGDQGRGGHRFLAMDKKTGEVLWWAEPGGQPLDTIYSNPVVAVINGERLLICGGADGAIHAMQCRTGRKVWSYPLSRRGINVSPVVAGNFVFITQGEENLDTTEMGAAFCFDASQVANGQPKLVWRRTGIRAGYASPIVHEQRLYVPENGGKLFCLNTATGDAIWEFRYGTEAKASPVLADGKIYVGEVASKFHVLEPGDKSCKRLSVVRFPAGPDGENFEINSSPAVADGRIFFATVAEFYCIGNDRGKGPSPGDVPGLPPEAPVDPNAAPAHVQVVPAEVAVAPGSTVRFKARTFDAKGRVLKETAAEWSLPAPTPPPPPPGRPAPPAPPPLRGQVSSDGTLALAKDVRAQAGYVEAKVGNLTGRARVRVYPTLPIDLNFDALATGAVPSGWVNTAGKFAIAEEGGNKFLKKLANNPNSLLARANAYLSSPALSDYTIQADLLGKQKGPFLPDMGVVNTRYSLTLDGSKQRLLLRTWEARKAPGEEVPGRVNAKVDFPWKPDVWYRFRLKVAVEGDKAILLGKVWPRDEKEPADWTIKAEDPIPNREGSPALYGYAYGIPGSVEEAQKSPGAEIYYDNLTVTPNQPR